MLGRLASICAKQLLNGQHIVRALPLLPLLLADPPPLLLFCAICAKQLLNGQHLVRAHCLQAGTPAVCNQPAHREGPLLAS